MGGNIDAVLPSGKRAITVAFGKGGYKSTSYVEGDYTDADSLWTSPGAYTPSPRMSEAMLSKPSTTPKSGVISAPIVTWRNPTQYPVILTPDAPVKTNLEQVAKVVALETEETIPILTDPNASAIRSEVVAGGTSKSREGYLGYSSRNGYSMSPRSQRMTPPSMGDRTPPAFKSTADRWSDRMRKKVRKSRRSFTPPPPSTPDVADNYVRPTKPAKPSPPTKGAKKRKKSSPREVVKKVPIQHGAMLREPKPEPPQVVASPGVGLTHGGPDLRPAWTRSVQHPPAWMTQTVKPVSSSPPAGRSFAIKKALPANAGASPDPGGAFSSAAEDAPVTTLVQASRLNLRTVASAVRSKLPALKAKIEEFKAKKAWFTPPTAGPELPEIIVAPVRAKPTSVPKIAPPRRKLDRPKIALKRSAAGQARPSKGSGGSMPNAGGPGKPNPITPPSRRFTRRNRRGGRR